MNYVIITDSNCELASEYLSDIPIIILPFSFRLGGNDYHDKFWQEISCRDFYQKLRDGEVSTTSQITPFVFEEIFNHHLSEGKAVLYLGFSSGLSSTYNSALLARTNVIEVNPNADITIFDTKSASAGQGLLVHYAIELFKQGKSKEEVINILSLIMDRQQTWFIVDSLEHLKRGGRISAINETVGHLLKIKPILKLDKEGEIVFVDKVSGRKNSVTELSKKFIELAAGPEPKTIFIHHADCIDEAEYLRSLLLKVSNVKRVIINSMGAVIGSHTGPGSIAISFIGNQVT